MLEESDDGLGKHMRWRKVLRMRWIALDRLVLFALLSAWWFLLQRDVKVVDAVDTASYLAAVYSVWRSAGSVFRNARSVWVRVRRSEVPEARENRGKVSDLALDPAERVDQRGVAGREDVGSR
jgi:hypothetical protein